MDEGAEVGTATSTTDAELLAGLRDRGRGPTWMLLLGVTWTALALGQLTVGTRWIGVAHLVLAACQLCAWWVAPQPRVRAVTADALLVRRGRRVQTIAPADLLAVRPRYTGPYGLELTLRDAEPLRLDGTAPKLSVAEAQAAALRRWAGPDD